MLLSSEITVNLKPSKVFLRLVLISYGMTLGLIYCSTTYLAIKLLLSAVVCCHFLITLKNKNTSVGVEGFILSHNHWTLLMSDGQLKQFDKVNILIHNELFQLIQLRNTTTSSKRQLVVLFNDQVTQNELRLMHLKIATAPNLC